ncbi:hypothetical protein CORC01_00090 [Colletotrichum orchidophilum]|uniref:Uncharacterized protein n=1 Tax=Colletotrichum orchidophilum TaxID=1209926 RepID=A0A1G4BT69_9PEZI|nr:uncharacterized protein CORC01_00090 [Colletotrichum orchidophilum]OHF04619.1 hypothetical protein CORC01_00090 [Colletotrichum orchidophilum]
MVKLWASIVIGVGSIVAASPVNLDIVPLIGPRSNSPDQSGKGKCSSSCGKQNFVFTGLPWNHPAVVTSGFTPQQVEAGIRADMAAITKAGYNIKAVLLGPEDSLDSLSDELKGVDWTGTGVGFGVRGSPSPVITRRLMDTVQLYRDEVPRARILFNYSPVTSLWAIQQYFPLSSECSKTNGTDLGIAIRCRACSPPA